MRTCDQYRATITSSATAARRPSTVASRTKPPRTFLAGLRDRALLLTGFVGALRRSELSALDVADVAEHPSGLVLTLPRSKTNQRGDRSELVVLPRGNKTGRCPVTLLKEWTERAQSLMGHYSGPSSSLSVSGVMERAAACGGFCDLMNKCSRQPRRSEK